MAKRKKRTKHPVPRKTKGSWTRLFLALTLVPLIFGVGLIFAWAFDVYIFGDPESLPLIGLLFILFSFAASNALQKNRSLAIGWFLLAVADLVLLLWVELWAQVLALIAGMVGVGFLFVGFRRRYKEEQAKTKK
jgi:hypothetical protein